MKSNTAMEIDVMGEGGSHYAEMVGQGNGVIEDNEAFLTESLNTDVDGTGCTGNYPHEFPSASNAIMNTLNRNSVDKDDLRISAGDLKVEPPRVQTVHDSATSSSVETTDSTVSDDCEADYVESG